MRKKYKLFFDSSALISGLNSPSGASGIILAAGITGEFVVYVSEQVLEEVRRNIDKKFPLLEDRFLTFMLTNPKIVKQPLLKEVRKAHQLILTEDAPILAAAIKVNPDFLITWDKKDFLRREVLENTSFVICTPKEFIQKYWKRA